MLDVVRKDILAVLKQAQDAWKENDYDSLLAISNRTTHNIAMYGDEDSLAIALLLYAVNKIAGRCSEQGTESPDFLRVFRSLQEFLEKGDEEGFRKELKQSLDDIRAKDKRMHLYVEDVLKKARLKKGAKLHEHGLSAGRAAELLGISKWELMSYLGKTFITDTGPATDPVKRFKKARELFK